MEWSAVQIDLLLAELEIFVHSPAMMALSYKDLWIGDVYPMVDGVKEVKYVWQLVSQ